MLLAQWLEEKKLTASDGAEFDEFGYAVSISGDVDGTGSAVCVQRDQERGSHLVGRWLPTDTPRISPGT